MGKEEYIHGTEFVSTRGMGVRRADVDPRTEDLHEIAGRFHGKRAAQYDELDRYFDDIEPEEAAFGALVHVGQVLEAQGSVDLMAANLRKDELLGNPIDSSRKSELEEKELELFNRQLAAAHAREAGGDVYKVVERRIVGMALSLADTEESITKIEHANPRKPLQWRSVGRRDNDDIRRNPLEPTHDQIRAGAISQVGTEFLSRVSQRLEGIKLQPPVPRRPKL